MPRREEGQRQSLCWKADQVVLSAVQPDTIARRFATRQLSEQEGKGEEHE